MSGSGSVYRAALALLAASLLTVTPVAPAAPGLTFVLGLDGPCDDVVIDSDQDVLLDAGCANGQIRPGAWASGCTLNFILTDGDDYYAATAGHCGGYGKTFYVSGVGAIGSVVFHEFQPALGGDWKDWDFIKIDAAKESFIEPQLLRWGGPVAPGALPVTDEAGLNVRDPLPGESVYQYGHGMGLGKEDATKGRVFPILANVNGAILSVGSVGPGDSGSPARLESGEAATITSAYSGLTTGDNRGYLDARCTELGLEDTVCAAIHAGCDQVDDACDGAWNPGGGYGLIVFTSLQKGITAFEAFLGHDVWVVSGDLPDVVLV